MMKTKKKITHEEWLQRRAAAKAAEETAAEAERSEDSNRKRKAGRSSEAKKLKSAKHRQPATGETTEGGTVEGEAAEGAPTESTAKGGNVSEVAANGDNPLNELDVSTSDDEASEYEEMQTTADGIPTNFNDIPKIEPFAECERPKRRERFREWLKEVKRAMAFARNWDEARASAWLGLVCGAHLHRLVEIYSIKTIDWKRPFSGLLEAIDRKFDEMMDETVEYQRLVAFKQGDNQPVADFYEKYMELVKGMDLSAREIKTYFLMKLRDKKLMEHAATANLDPEQIVMAASRKELLDEALRASETARESLNAVQEAASHEALAVNYRPRPRGYAQRPGPKRARGDRGGRSQTGGCPKCGVKTHRNGVCPAKDKACLVCGAIGHFAKMCKQRRTSWTVDRQGATPEEVNY
jgi:hypothetical protein